jgi:glycosyltransferase involved in cell wall biosynthesis
MHSQVDILLATYQGELYLEEFLQSLFRQTMQSFHLWARDDQSSDSTPFILEKWAKQYPEKITILSTSERLGAKKNFSFLMENSQAPYIMFADQDDHWLPHKIEKSLTMFQKLEKDFPELPLVLYTDVRVVDENLKELSPSFWSYAGLNPYLHTLNRLLSQNVMIGCTMLMNRTLVQLAQPIPKEAFMHDWWVGLVAASFGKVIFFPEVTLLYRQHTNNHVGVKKHSLQNCIKKIRSLTLSSPSTYQQAKKFLETYFHILSAEKKILLEIYSQIPSMPYLKRKKNIIYYGFYKHGFIRNIKQLLSSI